MDILNKLKKAELVGCGGACFPTAEKWDMVKKAPGKTKFVICNASEGEPNVFKDEHIFIHWPQKVIDGMKLAIDFLSQGNKCIKGYIYINHDYYQKYGPKLRRLIKKANMPIELFLKPKTSGYIGGEETTILNIIEGKKGEPRLRPPYPTTSGLWNAPTLVNNVETLYHVSLINSGEYDGHRFYTVDGDCPREGVFKLPGNLSVEKVLKETNNMPNYNFFVQVGGGISGEILNSRQLKKPVGGVMSITIYRTSKWKPRDLIEKWVKFFVNESCGQCTPCREGNYRLLEILEAKKPDWQLFSDLLDNLEETSFCGLGCIVPIPIKSYIKNILANKNIKIVSRERKSICECFK